MNLHGVLPSFTQHPFPQRIVLPSGSKSSAIGGNGTRYISVQGEYPFEDAICVTDQYVLRGVRIPVRFNGEQLELPVVIRRKYNHRNQFIADFLTDAVKLADQGKQRLEYDLWQKLTDDFWDNFNKH